MLLTRSPLTLAGTSTTLCSLDLHVLGTPPAFVLSQDQTLMKNFFISLIDSFTLLACFLPSLSAARIFGCVITLVITPHFLVCLCLVFNVLPLPLATTSIYYHVPLLLSNTFFTFFRKSFYRSTSLVGTSIYYHNSFRPSTIIL